jgi:hypothetical protein
MEKKMSEEGQEQEQAEEKNTTLGTGFLLLIGAWFLYSLFSGSDDHTLTSFIDECQSAEESDYESSCLGGTLTAATIGTNSTNIKVYESCEEVDFGESDYFDLVGETKDMFSDREFRNRCITFEATIRDQNFMTPDLRIEEIISVETKEEKEGRKIASKERRRLEKEQKQLAEQAEEKEELLEWLAELEETEYWDNDFSIDRNSCVVSDSGEYAGYGEVERDGMVFLDYNNIALYQATATFRAAITRNKTAEQATASCLKCNSYLRGENNPADVQGIVAISNWGKICNRQLSKYKRAKALQ